MKWKGVGVGGLILELKSNHYIAKLILQKEQEIVKAYC